jgi:hypothetical protein
VTAALSYEQDSDEWSANLPLQDYGRFARDPSRIDVKRGDHFLQPRFLTVSGLPAISPKSENSLSQSCFRTIAALRQFVDALIHHIGNDPRVDASIEASGDCHLLSALP